MLRTRYEAGFQPVFDFLPPASRAEHLYRIGRELAPDEAGLMDQARAALKAYDAARRGDDDKECRTLSVRLDAIAERLPADDEDEDGEERLARLLAATPAKVPLWGQKGGFIITAKFRLGVTCRLVIRSDGRNALSVSAFDWSAMFLTASGYLELYVDDEVRGRSVKQVALAALRLRQKNLQRPQQLVPLVDTIWERDPETGVTRSRDVPGQPDEDDVDWQPGGWLYELRKAEGE